MLLTRNEFLSRFTNDGIAVCGKHVGDDSIHVGLAWHSEGEMKVIHFQDGQYIPVQPLNERYFEPYYFNLLADFPKLLLPSLAAVAELISENKINGFVFNRKGVVFDDGKFEFEKGTFIGKSTVEKFVNCGVFVLLLLNTYKYRLIDWHTWPKITPGSLPFLETWLNQNFIFDQKERKKYYNLTRELRGKHILVSPNAGKRPVPFSVADPLATKFIDSI